VAAHAQRMSSLLASDKGALCRASQGGAHTIGGEVRAGMRERGYERRQRRHARGPTEGLEARARARSARRTCRPCP